MKLLIIEDDPIYLQLLRGRLAMEFEITTARGTREAGWELGAKKFDAILLDVGLPDADRETVVGEIKAQAHGAAVIVLSGHEDQAFMQRCIRQSASNYLVKGRDDVSGQSLGCHIRTGIKLNQNCQGLERGIQWVKGLVTLPLAGSVGA